jgi:acyl carrier protein
MTVTSSTPEGFPGKCPICGTTTRLDPSEPLSDAPCPACGFLLTWMQQRSEGAAETGLIEALLGDPQSIADLPADSMDVVEFVMAIEEHFGISIPDEEYERIRTIGDAIRLLRRLLEEPPPTDRSDE